MALRADDVDLGRDRDLVERFQNGDPDAFDDLYRRYFGRLHRFCLRHTGDAHEAEEVAQEAFVRALRSMDSLRGERHFYPWMTVIAKRITIDRHRKQSRVELTDQPDLGTVEPDIEHLFAAVDAQQVRAAMDRVGPRHREVLVLREAEGMSYNAIAAHLEVPVTTVEALLHRARKALRREYAVVSGEGRGMLGVPVLGWALARFGSLRAALGDRWAEAVAVVAPVAVGAITAAVVLAPGSTPAPTEVRTSAPVVTVSAAETSPATPASPPPAPLPAPASPHPGAGDSPDRPASTVTPPAVDAGPVDVFTGPEGGAEARRQAEQMPLHRTVGPATGGADDQLARQDAAAFLADAIHVLTGSSSDAADQPDPVHDALLGGTP